MTILPAGDNPGLILGVFIFLVMSGCVAVLVWLVLMAVTESVPFRGWRSRKHCQACGGVPLVLLTGAAAEPALNRYGNAVVNAGGLCPRHAKRADRIKALERELLSTTPEPNPKSEPLDVRPAVYDVIEKP